MTGRVNVACDDDVIRLELVNGQVVGATSDLEVAGMRVGELLVTRLAR